MTFEALLKRGVATRPQLSEMLGLSKQTISLAITELQQRTLVEEVPTPAGSLGRTATSYSLHSSAGWVAGVDLGPTRVRVIAGRLDATVIASRTILNPRPNPSREWPDALDFAAVALAELISHVPESEGGLVGLGMAVPRPIDAVEDVISSGNSDIKILAPLAPIAPAAIWVENDVNCAALSFSAFARGAAHTTDLYLKVGAGVGAAILVDGAVVRGARGRAGEVRRLAFGDPADGTSVEDALGAVGFLKRAGRIPQGDVAHQLDELHADAARGSRAADAAVRAHAEGIASLIDTIAAVVDPNRVILTGYSGDRAIVHSLVGEALNRMGGGIELVRDPFGDQASARGAARLASSKILEALLFRG
ncbi:ROK family transcriptional regulator [Leifsonia aquatica]|uniref:ROK family transcriptional regulator n=1 Tax=Leifsonia aquatica TaxID=144185 RepID=UPI0028A8AEE8|nr:ROK family transcriptional regulator [Leifsonia aquatica]